MTDLIDPEELPFTPDEVFRAACLFSSAEAAHSTADVLRDCGPGVVESRAKRRARWKAGGVEDADSQFMYGLCYPEQLLPALASLSEDAYARALGVMTVMWRDRYRMSVSHRQRLDAEARGLIPTRAELEREYAGSLPKGKKGKRMPGMVVVGLPTLPPPTSAMMAAAEAEIEAEKQQWMHQVEAFKVAASAHTSRSTS